MHANEVIEAYIDDTVRLLPKRSRDDVATELRSLLNDEFHAKIKETGREGTEVLALELVRQYGRPNEVAARYQAATAIIDPADSANFLRAAIIGTCVLSLLITLKKLRPDFPGTSVEFLKIGILAWLGFLVIIFAAKAWMGRRWPSSSLWKPSKRDRVNRVGVAIAVPVATSCIAFYAAPKWFFDQFSKGRFDASWATYTAEFERDRLPLFLGLMIGSLVILIFASIEGKWRRITRRINIGINLALACQVLSFALEGNLFASPTVDTLARNVAAAVAIFYLPGVGLMLYREIGRIKRVEPMKVHHAHYLE